MTNRTHNILKSVLFILVIVLLIGMPTMFLTTGCDDEVNRVQYNISREADNFNIVRRVTVIDCITGDVLFQMSGRMSINADTMDDQLEIYVEDTDGSYQKHIIGLSDNVTYVVEDLNLGANDVSRYRYTINFNPNMWIPVEVDTID